MSSRQVVRVLRAMSGFEGAGFPIFRPSPLPDPFLMLDELGPIDYAPGKAKGAPHHPHRGFITVTYMLSGNFVHKDSMGNKGRMGPGDVQYMVAGSGVIHDESPAPELLKNGGLLHGFQLWVNLPASLKMTKPSYQDVSKDRITQVDLESGGRAKVIAGTAFGVTGPVVTHTPFLFLDVQLDAEQSFDLELPSEQSPWIYVYEGAVRSGSSETVPKHAAATFSFGSAEDQVVRVTAERDGTRFLLLSGKPLGEPIARSGPFVMNTAEEIETAFHEYRSGTFIKEKAEFL